MVGNLPNGQDQMSQPQEQHLPDDVTHQSARPTMRCIEYAEAGGTEVIEVVDRPIPEPGPGEVLVKVAAAGINRADVLQRQGHYPPPEGASDIPGLEVSGTVEELGAGVDGWEFGTPVCALLAGGGYAEYVSVPAGQLAPVPDGVSVEQAAALPEVAATCWSNLMMRAHVEEGEWVLVHGGTGGIGSFALQLLAAVGARPLTTAGGERKVELSRSLGAEEAFDHRSEDFVERVHEVTGGHGADVILDVMGGKYLEPNVKALAPGGRLVVIGLQGGQKGELAIGRLMGKGAWVTGSTLRSQPARQKAEIMRQVVEHVWPLVEAGTIRPQVDRTFSLAEAAAAHEHLETADRTGKVLLVP